MTYSETIKHFRKKKGLTQKQLADLCGITQAAIANYEAGKSMPAGDNAYRIAKALNISVSEIYRKENAFEFEEDTSQLAYYLWAIFSEIGYEYSVPDEFDLDHAEKLTAIMDAFKNNGNIEIVGKGQRAIVGADDLKSITKNALSYFEYELNKLIQKAGAAEDGKEN